MADARERRAVLHELFLVEAQRAVGGLDDGELILVVVDGEAAREAGADARQRIAIAPQQPHAEGMERGKRWGRIRDAHPPAATPRARAFRRRLYW